MTTNISLSWEQLLQQGKQAGAQQDFGRAEFLLNNALEKAFEESAPDAATGEIFYTLGQCLEAQNKNQDAVKRYKQALGTLERSHGPDAATTAAVRNRLKALTDAMAVQPNVDPNIPASAPAQSPKSALAKPQRQHQSSSQDPTYDELVNSVELNRGNLRVEDLVHPREKSYGFVSSGIGIIVYGLSAICLVGLVLAPLAWFGAWIAAGLHLGALRSRGIKVSDRQFPEVFTMVEQFCSQMKMEVPQVYVFQEHGLLNAFAQRLHRKDLVLISADVLEMAYEYGQNEVAFVICHELSHVKLGHVKNAWLHIPGAMVPFLGTAYSRACEYSCDRIAQHFAPEGALYGLVALAAGTKLYRHVNLKAMYEDAEESWGFWTWYHEIRSTHPNLVNRIRSIGITEDAVKRS